MKLYGFKFNDEIRNLIDFDLANFLFGIVSQRRKDRKKVWSESTICVLFVFLFFWLVLDSYNFQLINLDFI